MGNSAGAGCGRIRHYSDASGSKKIWNSFFCNIARKLHPRIIFKTLRNGGHITRSSGMVAARNNQFQIGQALGN